MSGELEEILASIRRLLHEDGMAETRDSEARTEPDVFMLDRTMIVGDRAPPPPAESNAAEPSAGHAAPDLLAPEAVEAASGHLDALRQRIAERQTPLYAGGPTLEDMVRAELRPLLKTWLDANLPGLVERVVQAEIERVVARTIR